MAELTRYRYPPIRVRLDEVETQAASVIVSKGRSMAGVFGWRPTQVPGEPGFSVILFDRGGPAGDDVWRGIAIQLFGTRAGRPAVRANRIDFIGNEPLPAQTDGDPAGCGVLR